MDFVSLGSIGAFENIGTDKKIVEGEQIVTLLNYVDVYHHKFIDHSIPTMQVSASDKKRSACTVEKGDIFVTPSSETIDDIGHSAVITEDLLNTVYSYHIMRYRLFERNQTTSCYINYVFDTESVKKQIVKLAQGLTRFGLSKDKFASIEIPLPSPTEQQRIVDVLDKFEEIVRNLERQIELRRKQYEVYREKMMHCDGEPTEIGTYVEYPKGRIDASSLNEDNYISVENLIKDKGGKTKSLTVPQAGNWLKYDVGDVLIGNIRPYLRKIWIADCQGGTNGDVIVVRSKNAEKFIPRYIYHLLASDKFFTYYSGTVKDGKMPRGTKDKLLEYQVYMPSPEEQRSIVSKLDKFEEGIGLLKEELALRSKQYEYYREKLLTFE